MPSVLTARFHGQTLPAACQDWASTKAAYRFFSNPRVDESVILAGHFAATRSRIAATKGPVLILHDTTEFSYRRDNPQTIGKTHITYCARKRPSMITVCGLLMHSSLALTPEGKPLGLTAIKFWTRKKFKGARSLYRKVNVTRIPIERKESIRWLENIKQSTQWANPSRCVHIGDRESDIYELFCVAQLLETNFLVRTCADRLAGSGGTTVAKVMSREPIRGTHKIEVLDANRQSVQVQLKIRYRQMTIHPPTGKKKGYPSQKLTVIHACECGKPTGRKPIHWKLLTNLPVNDLNSAIEKLDWYAQRWKIETFHKVLKSGCRAEDAKLRTAQRLTNMLAVLCIIAWRVFWLTMVNRTNPASPPSTVFTSTEINILNHLAGQTPISSKRRISHYLMIVAKLGGYLARGHDPPPGNMVLWRGLARLTDIHLGFELHDQLVGN